MDILLVDDDAEIRSGFTAALSRRGHQVHAAATVADGLDLAADSQPDVGIIDVMLPDGDGFSLCREIRARWGFPTIMLTARDEEVDIVGGLEAGADDYVVKPVSPAVLEARLRAVLRRGGGQGGREERDVRMVGQLAIDVAAAKVTVEDRPLDLSATEFRLLSELIDRRGHALSREQLIDMAWRESLPNTPRVVDTTIQRLRAKLAQAGVDEPQLETLRGISYRLR